MIMVKILSSSIYMFYSNSVKFSKFHNHAQIFAQVYVTFYALKFKLEMINIRLEMKSSKFSRLLTIVSCMFLF